MSHRIEFKLSMPGSPSWNGKWSGEGKNFAIVLELTDAELERLFDLAPDDVDLTAYRRIWTHGWSDGWIAQITARVVPVGEELKQSDGFNGYDWMIDNILTKGTPYGEATS